MSARESTSGSAAACSGAMYVGVPTDMPICVSVSPVSCGGGSSFASETALAIPKSETTAAPPQSEDVVGLDVAVDHAALVREGERLGDVAEQADRLADRQGAVLAQVRAQRPALLVRHRIVGHPADLPGGEQRDDVRVLELRREHDLAPEAVDVHAAGELLRQHLHDDAPAQRLLLREEDAAHAAAAELRLDGVELAKRRFELVAQIHAVALGPRGGEGSGRTVLEQGRSASAKRALRLRPLGAPARVDRSAHIRSLAHDMSDDNGNVLTDITPASIRRIHLVGVAGTGMGSFAGMLKAAGYEVTGSDENVYPPMSDMLAAWGVTVMTPYAPANLDAAKPDLVIIGNVIRRVNLEATAVRERGHPADELPRRVRVARAGRASTASSWWARTARPPRRR